VTRAPSSPPKSEFAYQSVRIKNPEELAKVRPVLDYLSGKLGWEKLPPMLEELEEKLKKEEPFDPELKRIISQYPSAAVSLLKVFDEVYRGDIEIEDFDLISDYMKTALQSLLGKQTVMVNLLTDIINKLGEEKTPEGIQKLLKLMEEHTLPEITTVASIITTRLQKLRVFEASIQNENAYEIKGVNSVHNQIAQAMWIIDDAYWLLHANEPLTNFLKKEYSKATKEERRKPDYICVSNEHALIIVEIKRPSHEMTMDDINQIQDYLATIEEHRPEFVVREAYLVGKTMSAHLQKILENITNVKFKPYTKLVDDCKRRYQQYLEALERTSDA
jgi:Ca2+-binding EF-hand superfamily protein